MEILEDHRSLNKATYKDLTRNQGVILHRTLPFPNSIWLLAEFSKTGRYTAGFYTGGKMPYHIVIGKSGRGYWFIDFDKAGVGAAQANPSYIQIALEGDFRSEMPTPKQMSTLYSILGELAPKTIIRHDDARNPPKGCPGVNLDVEYIKKVVCHA